MFETKIFVTFFPNRNFSRTTPYIRLKYVDNFVCSDIVNICAKFYLDHIGLLLKIFNNENFKKCRMINGVKLIQSFVEM